ncbi:MAG: DUF1192 domain-containing protein [Aquisalinus sp.]|nr:DUF1192 domain-containing protein [Aquisalinus sp.]
MDDVLKASVTDPRGERLIDELTGQDLSALSVSELGERIELLKGEISRCEAALEKRQGATAAAEALFKS